MGALPPPPPSYSTSRLLTSARDIFFSFLNLYLLNRQVSHLLYNLFRFTFSFSLGLGVLVWQILVFNVSIFYLFRMTSGLYALILVPEGLCSKRLLTSLFFISKYLNYKGGRMWSCLLHTLSGPTYVTTYVWSMLVPYSCENKIPYL